MSETKASLAGGWLYGVAKKANLIIVPLPWKNANFRVKFSVWIEILSLIQNDIRQQQETDSPYSPVILIPKEFDKPSKDTDTPTKGRSMLAEKTTIKVIERLKGLVALNASLVTAAGNFKVRP